MTGPTDPTTDRSRLWVWLGALLSVIAGSVLLFDTGEEPPSPAVAVGDNEPDLLLREALITSFREDGALKYLLRSPRIEHFEAVNEVYLTTPDLEIHSEPDPPWHMTARRGTIFNSAGAKGAASGSVGGEEEVLLEEDVRMAQAYDDGRSFELLTPAITVYPDREYAETDRDVMITTHAGRTRAVGLKGNLDKGLLHLFSNDQQRVHTIVLPDQFK